jgi:DNA-binding transcriptional ArsR family regulator
MHDTSKTSNLGRPNPPTLAGLADGETLEKVFKALANETRRGILAVLHDFGGWMTSHEIAQRFDTPWQGISRQLNILTEAGLIARDVRGKGRAYTLQRDVLRDVAGRWVSRVATEGIRRPDGVLVFEFDD